ncbi:MAG: hypothetical protein N2035_04960 [Chthoniobacterales bacterium]|nr:hypothetical protein [Chthoniobacterales bacterium]
MKRLRRLAQNMLCRQILNSDHFLPMKYFMLLGGFLGFVLTFSAGILAQADLWVALMHSSLGCVIGAFLMKVFRKVVASSVREVVIERHRTKSQEAIPMEG